MEIQVGFLNNFKGSDSLLFLGDSHSLEKFSNFVDSLKENEAVSLNSAQLFHFHGGLEVEIKVIEELAVANVEIKKHLKLTLNIPSNLLGSFSQLIGSVAYSNVPCHQYLECDRVINVIVSKGEYDGLFG